MNETFRYKAAAAVVALANRTESAGKKDAASAKGAQWQPMPYNAHGSMNVAKLREAVAYYEIAASIDAAAAGWGYPRAMLLESIGAWDEASTAFEALAGSIYGAAATQGIARCAGKKAGTYDELSELGLSAELVAAMGQLDADAPPTTAQTELERSMQGKSAEQLLADMEAYLRGAVAVDGGAAASGRAPADAGAGEGDREQATPIAQAFVDRLLDRDYGAAHAMLHPDDAGMSEQELRDGFESMFEGEAFPTSASVFDVQTDMPDLGAGGLAWVYVTIDSENAEAVSLVVARDRDELRVRSVEFGRA